MIDFFLTASRVKALLIGGGAAIAAALALLIGTLYLSGSLDTERSRHETTRHQRDAAVKEGGRWKTLADAEIAKRVILQGAVVECLNRESRAAVDAADRKKIMEQAQPRAVTPVMRKEAVDDATRKRAVDRLNRPL